MCGTKLEDYQLCLIHAINHWCGDREGKVMAFGYRVAIIILHYDFEAEEQTSNILSRLATENSELNASVARLAESRRYFFGRQALELQTKFEKERLDLPDRTATEMQDYENFLGLRPQSVTDT